MTNLIHTTSLTPTQKQDIRFLEISCREEEPLFLSAPTEDDLDYFLFYQKNQLKGMVYLFFPEPDLCECSGFVLPPFRRQGIFSRLLEAVTDFLDHLETQTGNEIGLCFLCDDTSPSSRAVLETLGCELWYSEHKMERSLLFSRKELQKLQAPASLHLFPKAPHIFAAQLDGAKIGQCQWQRIRHQVCFYGFEIYEPYRNQGYGTQFLQKVMLLFSEKGCQTMILQVSSTNLPALSLYQKTGFRITETLSYYWY